MNTQIPDVSLLGSINNIDKIYIISKVILNICIFILLIFTIYFLVNIGNKFVIYKKKVRFTKKYFIILSLILTTILFILILYSFKAIIISNLKPIIWAIIFSYLLNPIIHKLMEYNISRLWSVIIVYIGIISVIVIFSVTITPKITEEIKNFVDVLPEYSNRSYIYLNNIYKKYSDSMSNLPREFIGVELALREHINMIQIYIIDMFKGMTEKGLNFFSKIVSIVLIPIYTFYFLKDADFFRKKMLISIPKAFRQEVIYIARDINRILSKFIRGQLIIATLVGIMSIVALLILNVKFALLIGIIAGITNVVPYFGPIIGAIPGVIIALLDNPVKAIWVVITFFIIQQIESALLSPKIVGDSVGLHPVFVILSLLIGGELFGLAGLIFSVPLVASIKILINHINRILTKI